MIKILTKKQWIELNEVIDELRNTVSEERTKNSKLKIKLSEEYKINCNLTHKIEDLENSRRKLASAKGGLISEINKLKNEIKHLKELQVLMDKQYLELEEKYKESMTDKYLVKKIKPGRTPKGQQMKLKDCSRVSNITRKVISHYEKEI